MSNYRIKVFPYNQCDFETQVNAFLKDIPRENIHSSDWRNDKFIVIYEYSDDDEELPETHTYRE